MKTSKGNDKSSMSGKKATLTVPKSTGRHRDGKIKPVSGHAMKGGKFRK